MSEPQAAMTEQDGALENEAQAQTPEGEATDPFDAAIDELGVKLDDVPEAQEEGASQPEAKEEPKAEPEAKAEPEPEPEAKAKEEPEEAQQPKEPEEPRQAQQLSEEELQKQYEEWRKQAEEQIGQVYALDDEAYSALEENPREMLPKLLGRVYLDAVQGAAATVLQELPRLVYGVLQQGNVAQEAENAFYQKWKVLKDPKYQDDIIRVAQAYRAMDPNIPQDRLIDLVGVQVSLMHNLPIEGAQQEHHEPPPAYTPAGREGVPAAPQPPAQENPFGLLAEEMEEDGI